MTGKEAFIDALKASGVDRRQMELFHKELEKRSPELHERLLAMLEVPEPERAMIRAKAKA